MLPDIQIGDLWHSDRTGVTALILDVFDERGEHIAIFLDIADLDTFEFYLHSLPHSSFRLIARLEQ